LDVTPLVRRVVVDRAGKVDRIGLSVNVSHGRLSDLLIKLIAPSGRTVDLQFRQSSSSANELIRIEKNELASLVGEALSGTWSLSIRDEVTGIDGHLVGWNLSLNSQVIVESFDRGLDIPDPVEKASNKLWVAPNGRFAIARSLQSDGMRIWDLASGNAARTSAVAASENVIGLSTELGYLVTAAANSVNVWRTATGRRHATLSIGIARQPVRVSDDGRHLLVQGREGTNTTFELWSLETSKTQARIRVAGTPALVTIDASGSHIAIADYDRSVRVWDFKRARLLAQFNLDEQPSQIMLSPDGRRLGAVHGERGVSLWHADIPEEPLLQEWQSAHWQIAFSGTGQKFLAGSPRYGFQVYQSSDGSVMGPLLGSGMNENATSVLAFSTDEKFVLTASAAGISRLWNAPQVAAASAANAEADSAHALWQNAGNMISAIAPGGTRMAVGDSEGHVHIVRVGAGEAELADESDEISFIGHEAPVVALSFSRNGQLVASAGANNSIRVWDASSGLPKTYSAHGLVSNADQMRFSSDGSRFAINSGRRVSIIDVETGVASQPSRSARPASKRRNSLSP
jgi:WD40 repeat protein